jgi:tetratricopeptide (TPR) repeat protein
MLTMTSPVLVLTAALWAGSTSATLREIESAIAAGKFSEALRLLAAYPASVDKHLLASKAYDGMGDAARAVSEAEAALKLAPAHEAAHLQLGQVFLSHNTPQAAWEVFSEALTLLPESFLLRLGRGLAAKELQRYEDAESDLKACLQRRPDFPLAFDALATVYLHAHRYEEALALADSYRKRQPADYRGAYFAAAAREGLKQEPDRAIELARQAVRLNPRFAAAHALLGKLLLVEGQHDTAISALEQAIALRPNYTPAMLHLAQAYRAAGRSEDAARAFEQVRRLKAQEQLGTPSLQYRRGLR